MPSDRRIRVMISSRCKSKVKLGGKSVPMTELRREMKKRIEAIQPFGEQFFECWINEEAPSQSAALDVWEICRNQARRADILLVLYNGDPGWSLEPEGIGICHAELQAGLASSSDKVYSIRLPEVDLPKTGDPARNAHERFRKYVLQQLQFAAPLETGDQALAELPGILHEAVAALTRRGVLAGSGNRYNIGEALDWNRLDFADRKNAMEEILRDALADRKGAQTREGQIFVPVLSTSVLVCVHAVPGSLSTPAARELVGRPFHQDHNFDALFSSCKGDCGGPLHVIACHRSVTEKQAGDLLGQPDIYTVDGDFGVLAIDRVSKAQCLFLRNCRDDTTTRSAVQRAFDWLERSGENQHVAQRSKARRRILAAVAREN